MPALVGSSCSPRSNSWRACAKFQSPKNSAKAYALWAAARSGRSLTLRRHAGYDHGYYFIQTFMADHIAHHARTLGA